MAEGLEVARGLASRVAPSPLPLHGLQESHRKKLVERAVRGIQNNAEDLVEVSSIHPLEWNASGDIDVAGFVDCVRESGQPKVSTQQIGVDGLVILVRVAHDESRDRQGLLTDHHRAHRGELLLPGQGDDELPGPSPELPLDTGLIEELTHALMDGGTAIERASGHGITDRKSTRLNSSHANISSAVFC